MKRVIQIVCVVAVVCFGSVAVAETLFVPADGSGVISAPLTAGEWYIVEASGTYGYRDVVPEKIADAEWAYSYLDAVWVEVPPAGDLDLYVNGTDISMMGTENGVDFGYHVFSPSHVYRANVLGEGSGIALSIYDQRYDDNTGGLSVTITPGYQVPEPATLGMLTLGGLAVLRRRSPGRRRLLRRGKRRACK